ncbi:hypothetical protein GCM10018965_034470 [Nonomuraea roseola]
MTRWPRPGLAVQEETLPGAKGSPDGPDVPDVAAGAGVLLEWRDGGTVTGDPGGLDPALPYRNQRRADRAVKVLWWEVHPTSPSGQFPG